MAYLYTKNGRPLRRAGDDLFSKSGKHVARVRDDRAFGPDGRYVGTIVGDRLVYRSTHSARIGSPFVQRSFAASALANRSGSAVMGEEPPIPD
jgi:hypothetical protein